MPDLPVDATSFDTRADAIRAIEERDVDGAVILRAEGPEVLTASANGAAPSSILTALGTQLATAQHTTPTTTEIVPWSQDDPSGAGMNAMGFPLVLGGIVGGVLVSLLVVGVRRRLLALAAYTLVGGIAGTAVIGPLLGIAPGGFWITALALGLGMLGTASTVVGLHALLGTAGLGVGAVITMFFANPISGATMPYQFIVGPWGEVGQYFVPGAANSLFREVSYFPDASMLHEWIVLSAWILGGITLSLTGHFRSSSPVNLPESELDPAAAM
ncbi:hypothetical protein [Gordonia liuliyuniae]|uniref:ABC transporter permease n=1 Tax=Gordonia liuliyuniae TaxID=2911517 RepID=A0ABS9ISU4_9ACTN|nr:hypothetical protein [Gordonia liuliyuniae]MCF8588638.1 hypothetical protein [Gordonia liuliyuniae]